MVEHWPQSKFHGEPIRLDHGLAVYGASTRPFESRIGEDGCGSYTAAGTPIPLKHHCPGCKKVFHDSESMRHHTFIEHARKQPALVIHGLSMARHDVRTPLHPSHIQIGNCDVARLDGKSISPQALAEAIVELQNGRHHIVMENKGCPVEYELDVCIPSLDSIKAVEGIFCEAFNQNDMLDKSDIESFRKKAPKAQFVSDYVDGMYNYLLGILIKNNRPGLVIKGRNYEHSYNRASNNLKPYINRSIARTVMGLVAFHFNHYEASSRLLMHIPDGMAAINYLRLTHNKESCHEHIKHRENCQYVQSLRELLIDGDTKDIMSCVLRRHDEQDEAKMLQLRAKMMPRDVYKMDILLAELMRHQGREERARRYARNLANMPAFKAWADSFLMEQQSHG